MTFKMPRNLMAAVSVVAFAALLSSCGGGGGSSPVATMDDDTTMPPDDTTMAGPMIAGETIPSGTEITLPEGTDAPNVTFRAAMGDTVPVAGIGVFTCVSADGCSVDVTDDVVTTSGDIEVVSLEITDAAVLAQLANAISPPEVPEPTELEQAQIDAATAAATAKTASDDAAIAAKAATEAVANLATVQTGATSAALAKEAADYADKAMAAYAYAKKASEDAAAAEDVTAAVEARFKAEMAKADAVKYGTTASEKAGEAETAAMAELMIVGTVKTVGGTSLDATAGSSVVTTDGNTVTTGLLAEGDQPMHTVAESMGEAGVEGTEADPSLFMATTAGAATRTFPIGKSVDSADDMARLMIVTQYAGTKTVKVYAEDVNTTVSTMKAGYLTIDDGVQNNGAGENGDDLNNVALKSEGSYYLAGTNDTIEPADSVAATAKAVEVFSYVNPNETDNAAGDKTYVVWTSALDGVSTTTTTYTEVDIHVTLDRDGDSATADTDVEVTAKIPEATDYKHIHFGVWAALGEAEKNGTQKIADLGIGFVQSIGDGLTGADMPNNGTGNYKGNWVAAVREADEDGNGPIVLRNGDATVTANFGMGTITADLTNLAKLEGAITTNTFLGTKASGISDMHGLDTAGKFTGSFSGGFYGTKAAEAGGIFDFASDDDDDGANEGGAFRGAFGADRKAN